MGNHKGAFQYVHFLWSVTTALADKGSPSPTASPHATLWGALTACMHLTFPDDALYSSRTPNLLLIRFHVFFVSFSSVLQKEQVTYLYQPSPRLVSVPNSLWLHQIVKNLCPQGFQNECIYCRLFLLCIIKPTCSQVDILGSFWNTWRKLFFTLNKYLFEEAEHATTEVLETNVNLLPSQSQSSSLHIVCLRRNRVTLTSESLSLATRIKGHNPQTWVSFGQYVFPKDEVTSDPES